LATFLGKIRHWISVKNHGEQRMNVPTLRQVYHITNVKEAREGQITGKFGGEQARTKRN